ncbi:hypothetical protein Tco_1289717, partial [Tanacetum coccineum]
MGLESLESRIVVHEKNEAVYEEDISFLKYDVQVKDISIKDLKNQLEEGLKEKDDLKLKLEKFEESSKSLTKLINIQISVKDKAGLGYDSQMNESEVVHSVFNSRESDVDDSLVNDRFKIGKGFHAVPPPYTKNYMPSRPELSFVGLDDSVYKTKENTHRQVEYPRKSQSPRENRRNWNGRMTQKLRNGFEFIKKAFFVCGSFNHLIKDCDFYDKKMVKKPVLNNMERVTGQREIRPSWNNSQRVNHQNKFTHPHPKRNFIPTAVVTKLGQVPVNTTKQSSPRVAVSISIARPVNTVAPKSKVNDALPKTYSYFKAHSPVRRAFNQKSAAKTNKFNEKVNTARINNATTVGPKAVVSAAVGNGENVVKSASCWIWRPTGNVTDHTSKDSGSYMFKIFNYVDLQGRLKHMTGNKSFLTDYQEVDGGFVAFGGSPKGGKIRTGKLEFEDVYFEDVYFVKELKFNLFFVSQMCDKKNNVLFTETECLVLSLGFKLLDESQVLLKLPRHNNMYNFDLKNVVPSGGLTCLFTKATIDESNLWPESACSQSTNNKDADEIPEKGDDLSERNGQEKEEGAQIKKMISMCKNWIICFFNRKKFMLTTLTEFLLLIHLFVSAAGQERIDSSTQDVNTARPSINTASTKDNTGSLNINTGSLNINIGSLTVTTAPPEATHDDFFRDETELDMINISTTYPVPSTPNTRIH